MLTKIIAFCLFTGLLVGQNKSVDRDCVKLENDTKISLLNFSIGDGGCVIKNINYPIKVERGRVPNGFVYVTVLPKEVGGDGVSPKFILRSGEDKLAEIVLANLRKWNISKNASDFRIIFRFTVKNRKEGKTPASYGCIQGHSKPSIKMWVTPAKDMQTISVDVESKEVCVARF